MQLERATLPCGRERGLPQHRELVQPLQCMHLECAVQPCVLETLGSRSAFPDTGSWCSPSSACSWSARCSPVSWKPPSPRLPHGRTSNFSKIYSITCVSYHVFLCSPRIQLHPWDPVLVEVGENDHVKDGSLDTILIK